MKIAIVQAGPVYFNLEESIQKAVDYIQKAASESVNLIVFGESWLSGYPAWIDHCPEVAIWNNEAMKHVFAKMHHNSVALEGKEIAAICEAAKNNGIFICMGLNEKVMSGVGNGTIYNAFVFINEQGIVVNHHRKLVPTFNEKLVYGSGDAIGLKTVETSWGRMGGLICWEHWMPLSRQALHNENELLHIALWPSVNEMHQIACRHYAFEGRCFVIAAGQLMQVKDIPAELTVPDALASNPHQYLLHGNSCIVGPDGQFLLHPASHQTDILYFELADLEAALREKMTLDTSGHYNRWDIFDFSISRKRKI